ncbi:MAG: GNAT family N-acetyltransferase [Brevundimonas sp.]|uniref:GNAT family N-acetyltransferase n=1 Tax=Brevundimonas sp. TaxID=1871086 RepID=UPI00391BC686
MTVLVTERLRLRSARPGDLAAFHAILSDVEATRYWSTPPHRDLEQTRIWLDSMMSIPADEGVDFVVELAGEAIGKAGFYRWPEVGFILAPKAWGRGLAREAVGAAVDHVFREGLTEVATADVDPENLPSIRLLERLGFERTGSAERTWNIGGVWKDSLYFALIRDRWAARI